MLLSQHHFQQNDLRHFRVLASQLRLLSSFHFGVRHLRIDTVALTDGLYRVTELEAVFPDGLILNFFPGKNPELKSLGVDLRSAMPDDENEVTLQLSIAESSDETSPILGNPARFYLIDGKMIGDENIKENEVRIPRLFPNVFLFVGDIPPEFCIGFPLCKIIKIDGVYHVKNWTPPCFFIERHFPLWKRCENLAIAIREKAVFLIEKTRNASETIATNETLMMLRQLVTILPGFEALIYSQEIRPYELYQELAAVLGSVSVLIPSDIIPVMTPYDHCNIDECLYSVINMIEHYIQTVERGFSILPFSRKDNFFYRYMSANELEKATGGRLYVGIRTKKVVSMSDIDSWMRNAIIVSDFAIDDVRINRVKGARRSVAKQETVSSILPGVGVTIFEIDIDARFIKGEQNIHIFNPGNTPKINLSEIILYLPHEGEKR